MATMNAVGDNLNTWREPVFTFAGNEEGLKSRILKFDQLRKLDISSSDWEKYCTAVNQIIQPILVGMKKFASENFDGLILHDYIRQGSAREGLKVGNGLEFDCLLLFEIKGMVFTENSVFSTNGREQIIGLTKLMVNNAADLCERYPWLDKQGILEHHGYNQFINTKHLQEKVFKAVVDRACSVINDQIGIDSGLRRSACPPTFAFRISLDKELPDIGNEFSNLTIESHASVQSESVRNKPTLDIDIVPALLLRSDLVPDPYTVHLTNGLVNMPCKIYAVMKWAKNIREANMTLDQEYLWRESTCGYEKHMFDIARRSPSQRYLMTACRILKSYVEWTKETHPNTNQLHRVAVSYFLKNICFHCIALLTVPSNCNSLSGVKQALGYLLCFLDLCIKNENLPHFFYGNPWVAALFPNCSVGVGESKKNLYAFIAQDTFVQVERSFKAMMTDLKGFYLEFEFLDADKVGKFKELLNLPHTYKKT